ncbi:MMPL family transporter [Actinomadura gamaensis]|uniref:MMPL family transporter n=1 Tax=Actinomadura gamaensis TaxID=1763541 RepID=A0ABV9U668_9ACTN
MAVRDERGAIRGRTRRRVLWRVGEVSARRRWTVVVVWSLVVAAALAAVPGLLAGLGTPSLRVAGSPADRAMASLQRGFPELGGEQMVLAFASDRWTADDPAYLNAVGEGLKALARRPGVGTMQFLPRAAGQDRRHLYAVVGLSGTELQKQRRLGGWRSAIQDAARVASGGRVAVSLVGETSVFDHVKRADLADLRRAETWALPVALLVLAAGLGAVGAGLLPLVAAGVTIAVTCGVLDVLKAVGGLRPDTMSLTVAATIGLGLGLDYALLLLLRHRRTPRPGDVADTAGRTVVWCAVAVAACAATLLLVDAQVVRTLAVPAVVSACVAPLVVLTLLPALLAIAPGLAAPRRRRSAGDPGEFWARWARHLMRRPVRYAVVSATVLVLAAAPVAGIAPGLDFDRDALRGTDPGAGIARMEGDGLAGVTVLALPHRPGEPVEVSGLVQALRSDERVSVAVPLDNGRDVTAVLIGTRDAADRARTAALVRDLRDRAWLDARTGLPSAQRVQVAGAAATLADLRAETASRLWRVAAVVLGFSLVFLVAAMRSVLLPLKAVLMNVLTTGASFGLLTLVADAEGQRVNVLLPLLVSTIVFGLSLDYEVFLVHRIAEHYRATGDNTEAVARGLRDTARPITLAAAVLAATFASLLTADRVEIRQLGFAVATAIALDATLVRLVLVPALMRLLGRYNWWLPAVAAGSATPIAVVKRWRPGSPPGRARRMLRRWAPSRR